MKKHLTPEQHFKLAVVGFLGLVVLAIGMTAAIYLSRIDKIAVITKYAPYSASVYLNGAKIKNNATNYLSPGEYQLTAELDHFATNTETIVITKDTEYILGSLVFTDTAGEELAAKHKKDFLEVEGIFGNLLSSAGDKIKQKYPILDFLPINNSHYSISFTYKDDGSPKITVQAEPKLADIAVRKLLSLKNVNPANYDISFTTPNPFLQPTPTPSMQSATTPAAFIRASFSGIIDQYRLGPGHTTDDYYLTTIYAYDFNSDDSYAHFKVILKKSGDSWAFATTPQLLLTTFNAPSIPVDILNQANRL